MKRTAVEQPHLSSAKVSTDAHSATLYLPTVKSVPGHATWLSLNCKVSLAAEQVCARTPGPGAAHTAAPQVPPFTVRWLKYVHERGETHTNTQAQTRYNQFTCI